MFAVTVPERKFAVAVAEFTLPAPNPPPTPSLNVGVVAPMSENVAVPEVGIGLAGTPTT